MHTSCVLMAMGVWVGLAPAEASTIEAGAMRLTWDAAGRITRLDCAGQAVPGPARAPSGFAVRDCAVGKDYEALAGRATRTAAGVRVEASNASGALAVVAELTPEQGALAVRGEVRNLSDVDRAVSLRFALPVACKGWTWHTRLHRTETLGKANRIHLGKVTTLGSGRIALRPVAGISDARRTLGFAVPVDYIGQYDFTADPAAGLFGVVFDFAMTRHAPRFFKRVPFAFHVVVEPDGWGLRSVLARYVSLRPAFFERHTEAAGGWFAWGDILRQPAPICDYGLMFHEQPESKHGYAHDKALGIRAYPYIEPIMYQMCLGDQPADKRPEREFIIKRLHEWAKPTTTGRLSSGGYSTQQALQSICEGIIASGVHDAKGQVVIGSVGQYNWIRGTKWAAQFPLNLCPTIPNGAGQDRLAYVRRHLLDVPYQNGIYLDSYSGHLHRINYAADQFKHLSYAPQFDAKTFKPCTLNGMSAFEWVEALWKMLPAGKKELLPNLYGQPVPFPWHRLTVMGKEHWIDAVGPLMQQYRTMGYRKVVTQLPSYEDQNPRFLRNLLLLDVFPGGYARRTTDPPQGMRATYRIVIPLLRQLHRLGWEPVTHARATGAVAMVERYGRAPGPIAFAVHNPYDSGVMQLRLDAQRLGLPADAYVVDVLDGGPVRFKRTGGELRVAVGVGGDDTTLLVVGDAKAHGRWLRMLAGDRLDDVRLCLKEFAVRRKQKTHPAWSAVASLSGRGRSSELAAAAKAITGAAPTETRARELLDLAGQALTRAGAPVASASREPRAPASDVVLPWTEPFDELSPKRWRSARARGVRAVGGRLEMELPRDARSSEVHSIDSWPFVPRPLAIDVDFKFTHGAHDRYLRQSMKVTGTGGGPGQFLLIRIESTGPTEGTIWLENHNAPPSRWTYRLTEKKTFDPARTHHMRLRLDRRTFRFELDGKRLGEGEHECDFGWAFVTLGVYSGHKGRGDVCWWDNLRVSRAR